jgi:predicted transcriptional regulator
MQAPDSGYKTTGVRLDNELHAQLTILGQLDDATLTDEIQRALREYVERRRSSGELQEKAQGVLAAMDREAATRRQAIESLLSGPPAAEPRSRSGRRGEAPDSSA